jgi:type I restriction enzyme M protein
MIGAIIGDIVGSIFEWDNIKTKDFTFLSKDSFFTDDTVLTIAIGCALMRSHGRPDLLKLLTIKYLKKFSKAYPYAGYGTHFKSWVYSRNPKPYQSLGNGAGMRVSAVGIIAQSEDEVKRLSKIVTAVTHDHEEGLLGAEAIAMCVYLARTGASKEFIKQYVINNYYDINFSLDSIRQTYTYDISSRGSTPQAIVAFLEADHYEDAIRNAISIGGDSDTIAAMTGAIAGAYFGIPKNIVKQGLSHLSKHLLKHVNEFERIYPTNSLK